MYSYVQLFSSCELNLILIILHIIFSNIAYLKNDFNLYLSYIGTI